MPCLSFEDINHMIMTGNFTYFDEILDSAARLAEDIPVKCDLAHI